MIAPDQKIMVGPSCKWPLRCRISNEICAIYTRGAGLLCQCEACRAWRHWYKIGTPQENVHERHANPSA